MKTFFCIVLVSVLLSGCEKDGSGHFELDKTMYLTIETGGKTYSTYGYTNSQSSDMFGGPSITLTYYGANEVRAGFVTTNKIESGINTVEFVMGDIYADWYMSKPGTTFLGNYPTLVGNQENQIIRVGDPALEYWFDKNEFNFNITIQDNHNNRTTLEGSFSGKLHLASDTSVKQSAIGQFRAYSD